MNRVALAVPALAFAATIATALGAPSRAPHRPPAAVAHSASFTEDQAWRGRFSFIENCAECHSGDLGGQFGPALRGPNSNIQWQTPKDVYSYMTAHMPVKNAGGLPQGQYIDLMAYLLQQNGRRAGHAALTVPMIDGDPANIDGSR